MSTCNYCGTYNYGNTSGAACRCQQQSCVPYMPPCGPLGCPITLDTKCIIYHKDNNSLTGLLNLGLNNGATLELILESIDSKLIVLDFYQANPTLTYLRSKYVINNLTDFATKTDTELGLLQSQITGDKTWTTAGRPTGTARIPGIDGYNLTTHTREYWNETTWISY